MTLKEAIVARHSVRKYENRPLSDDVVKTLKENIDRLNREGNLHMQLVTNEKRAFTGMFAYGKFYGVENYVVMVGEKNATLNHRVGYYGEQIVLLAQTLGLNTCWVGLSYREVKGAYEVADGEKLVCMIALGYGANQGVQHPCKPLEKISNISEQSPAWFKQGVEAASLAPSAINQQKFRFELMPDKVNGKPAVKASTSRSLVGYTHIDLGIAMLHFQLGAGSDNFTWV
ncbi:MAG: nitroreductase family protein [Muribaculaceae bacterium]